MATSCIDYFATLGLGNDQELHCHKMSSSLSDKLVHPSIVWNSAITDINIIFYENDDDVPDDDENGNPPTVLHDNLEWELIKYTIEGQLANCNAGERIKGNVFFIIRRRSVSKKVDHITDIAVLQRGETAPDDFEVVIKSLSPENPAENSSNNHNNSHSVRIAVKRSSSNVRDAYINGSKIIDDICLVNTTLGETPPSDYIFIEKSLIMPTTMTNLRLSSEKNHLIYRHRPPMGLCDLPFQATTLDRFPRQDHPQFPLPVTELPIFVFPHSLKIKHRSKSNFPLPNFFTFVFTDVKGSHFYTACLQFYELISFEAVSRAAATIYGSDIYIPFADVNAFFCPKVICLVSQFPFYRAMSRYLKQLYSLSLSPTFCPLEFFISGVVSKVPLPVEGGRPFHVVLDASLISQSSRSMLPICFDLPSRYSFPHMDVDFAGPMRCLSIDHLMAIFALLLRESKIVFICTSNALLTEVMETFRCLLYPLTWSSCFITRLPDNLSGVLQAPGGFMIGMHVATSDPIEFNGYIDETMISTTTPHPPHPLSRAEDETIGSPLFTADHDWIQNLQSGTFITDLTQNKIFLYENKKSELLSGARINQILRSLPTASYRKLHSKIQIIAEKFQLCPQEFDEMGLGQFDSAFDFVGDTKRNWKEFPTNELRDAFLVFMCELIGDFSKYIRLPNLIAIQGATIQELFKIEDYLRDADKSLKIVLGNLLETQMFAYLIQQRIEEPSLSSVFYDQSVRVLTNLGLNSLNGDKRTIPTPLVLEKQSLLLTEKDQETPLYELVASFNELANAFSLSRKPPTLTEIIARRKRQYFIRSSSIESYGSYDSDTSTPRINVEKRQELLQVRDGSDLQLDDMGKGPLIIPGPSKVNDIYSSPVGNSLQEGEDEGEVEGEDDLEFEERPTSVRYRYSGGWPKLDITLLDSHQNIQHGLDLLRNNRMKSLIKIDPKYQLFIRPRIYRICYQAYRSLLRPVQMDMKVESKAAVSIILEIYSNSLLLLCIRCMCRVNQIGSILQSMAILSHLEQQKILKLLDETIWRALFVACGAITDENFSHKAICALFISFRSCNSSIDAVIYTLYWKSFTHHNTITTTKKKANNKIETTLQLFLDPFYHLEQVGIAWMIQQCSLSQQELMSPQGSDRTFSPETVKNIQSPTNGFWGMFKGKPKSQVQGQGHGQGQGQGIDETSPTTQQVASGKQAYPTLPSDLSKILQLSRGECVFALRKPRNILLASVPILSNSQDFPDIQNIIFTEQNLETRVVELQELYEQLHGQEEMKRRAVAELETKDATNPISIGKFEIAVCAVKGVLPPKDIQIKNIYVRCWLSINTSVKLKSHPNVLFIPESGQYTPTTTSQNLEYLSFPSIRPSNILVYFEVFGDYLRPNESICYAFDQSLGVGTISIDKISGNLTDQWIKLSYSTIGEKVFQMELLVTTKFTRQEESKHFFSGTKKETNSSPPAPTPARIKSQSFPVEKNIKEGTEKSSNSRESEGGGNKNNFSWTKKITSVFSLSKSNRESNVLPLAVSPSEVIQEETTDHDKATEMKENEVIPLASLSSTSSQEISIPDIPIMEDFDKKSKKWRNSLAMLTGELDLGEMDQQMAIEENETEESNIELSRQTGISQDDFPVDQERNSRMSSLERLSPKVGNKKRLSVAVHPLDLHEIQETTKSETSSSSSLVVESPPPPPPPPTPLSEDSSPTTPVHVVPLTQENVAISATVAMKENHPLYTSSKSMEILTQQQNQSNQQQQQQQQPQQQREESVTTEVAGSVKSEYQNVQHIADIQTHFIRSFDKVGLGIYSMTPCSRCGHTLLDEEFLSIWGGFCDHTKDMTGDVYSSHIIICPICKFDIIPKLHVKLYQLAPQDPTLSRLDIAKETCKLECIWSIEVRHLSPFGLRLLTEHVLEQEGFILAEAEWMVLHHPDLYWNSLWYSTRLNLPNGFYSSKDVSKSLSSISNTIQGVESLVWVSTIVISWRECVLKSKVLNVLLDKNEGILTLQDILPGITTDEEQAACEIINSMDGTVASVASSLLRINRLNSVWNIFTGTKGRKLYLAFLILVQFYHPTCLMQYSPEVPHGLSKGTQFDRALIEALSIAFTQKDFELLQTKENELNIATSNRAAQATRIALGHLL